jgi:thiamine biosynthesis lipoprotein
MKWRLTIWPAVLVLLLVSFALFRNASRPPHKQAADTRREAGNYISLTETIMAAPITVVVPEKDAARAGQLVFDIFRRIDAQMSEWKPTSPLSEVNQAAGRHAVAVPADVRAVIRRGMEMGRRTEGAFDITWAALWGLWDFNAVEPRLPEEQQISRRVELVDYRRVLLDEDAGTVFLPRRGMMIGLGGIAKGHALDQAAVALNHRGITSFLISAGGQTMLGGLRDRRPWRVGIRDPRAGPDEYFAHLAGTDVSVATSGDYERYFILDGVRYHHILDPHSGRPTRGVRSATVVAADATRADALSTSVMVLGIERGLALIEQMAEVEAVLVDDGAKVHVTSGLAETLHVERPPTP